MFELLPRLAGDNAWMLRLLRPCAQILRCRRCMTYRQAGIPRLRRSSTHHPTARLTRCIITLLSLSALSWNIHRLSPASFSLLLHCRSCWSTRVAQAELIQKSSCLVQPNNTHPPLTPRTVTTVPRTPRTDFTGLHFCLTLLLKPAAPHRDLQQGHPFNVESAEDARRHDCPICPHLHGRERTTAAKMEHGHPFRSCYRRGSWCVHSACTLSSQRSPLLITL